MKLLYNIKFWIILLFAARIIYISNPPLEVAHNWRQSIVAMVARNFLETDNNIFFPRIDFAGEKSGITGMEFPLFNYMIYIFSLLFGYDHWYGRLINLVISSIGIFYYYRLLKKYFTEKLAFLSSFVLLFSLWFAFAWKIMPDTFAVSLMIIAVYYGLDYMYNARPKYNSLIAYCIFLIAASLSKISSAYLLIILILPFINKTIPKSRKIFIGLTTVAGIVPCVVWYFYWTPYLVETYGFWHFFMGKNLSEGFIEIFKNLPQTLERFYGDALNYISFGLLLFGTYCAIKSRDNLILSIFILGFAGFSFFVIKSGYNFPHHSYYVLPIVPVMSLMAGYGLSQIKNKILLIVLLTCISIEGTLNQLHHFNIKENNKALLSLEKDLNKVSGKDELILVNSSGQPTPMYLAHRRGWTETNENIQNEAYISGLKYKGLKHIVILKKAFGEDVKLPYMVSLENDDYCIYTLKDL
ncbi:MAG: ArnT family glycosyltransferase [Cytophagaceae bacterium]